MNTVSEQMLRWIDRGVDLIHAFGALVCIPVLTLIVTVDVVLRYAFNAPFDWAIEFNETMLLFILFGSLPFTTKVNGHIRMELLYRHFKGNLLRLANALWAMAGLFFSILLAVRTAQQIPFYIKINKASEFLGIPAWLPNGFVFVCAVLMAIYFLHLLFFGVREVEGSEDWEAKTAKGED
ncbi:MAG: TRAP transporter small permease [Alphaproteobacteria bacterium]|nr:TRAP transporter small permease [Alphaproteobacteria bacterium]